MIILTLLFLTLDIISKLIVVNTMNIFDSYVIIKNFFYITYVNNTGVAWSMLSGNRVLLTIISLVIIIGIICYIKKNKINNKMESVGYSMILGGALGNFSNRLFLGYVVDFLDFQIFGYDYPVFNLADTFIVVGVLILLISTWRKK